MSVAMPNFLWSYCGLRILEAERNEARQVPLVCELRLGGDLGLHIFWQLVRFRLIE